MPEDVFSSFGEDEGNDDDNENGHSFEEGNGEQVDEEQNNELNMQLTFVMTYLIDKPSNIYEFALMVWTLLSILCVLELCNYLF